MPRKLALPSHLLSLLVVASLLFLAPGRATAGNELTLHNFTPEGLGANPQAGLIADAAGNLYGVTSSGGTYNEGAVFEFVSDQHGGWSQQVLYNFRGGYDGGGPEAGLIFDAAGNLYGTTITGGPAGGCLFGGCGTVFELQPNPDGSWTKKLLHGFDSADGEDPQSGVVFDQQGNLYGVTSAGGPHDGGMVYQLSPSPDGPWKETVLHRFTAGGGAAPPPSDPVGPLVIDNAGNLFGVTGVGGNGCSGGCGTIYALSPNSSGKWALTILHDFAAGNDGAFPSGGLISDKDGNLYGATFEGGGGTGTGCNYGCGTVYKFSRGGLEQETVLYAFQGGSDGNAPGYSLTFDGAGNLYGATQYGGGLGDCNYDFGGCGTVFELTPGSGGAWSENVLWRFDAITSGGEPSGGVVLGPSGQLFGETFFGENIGQDGTVFALTPAAGQWSVATISGFAQSDGWFPETALVADSKGNLYGTSEFGGNFGIGAVFELSFSAHAGWNETMIYSFNNGGHRSGGGKTFTILPSSLIVDAAGNLYGETEGGGPNDAGIVYELSPALNGTWTEKTLYTFPGGVGGVAPSGGLVMDQTGNLYGVSQYGGLGTIQGNLLSGYGIVFELTSAKGTWSEQTLYQFAGYPADGAQPEAALIFDSAGNLYGTTAIGGSGTCAMKNNVIIGCGTAFQLMLQNGAWHETILHSFLGGTQDGQTPAASLVLDKSGNLYGTTIIGGSGYGQFDPSGTVFELSSAAGGEWRESLLFEFPDVNGQGAPVGSLVFDASGNLYSTTSGVSGVSVPAGAVFELSPNSSGGWNYQELYSFTNLSSGGSPEAGVIFGPDGYLYGTTVSGGNTAAGTVFAITQ